MNQKMALSRLTAVLLGVLLLISNICTVFATEDDTVLDLNKTGNIYINLIDTERKIYVSGGEVAIYQVAEITRDKDGNPQYSFTNGFENCGVSLDAIGDENSSSTLGTALQAKLTASSKGTFHAVGEDGLVRFLDLPLGLYLVVQTKVADSFMAFEPFAVSIPAYEKETGATVGTYNYTVNATPKVRAKTITQPPDEQTHVSNTPIPSVSPSVSPSVTPTGSGSNGNNGGSSSHSSSSSTLPQTGQLNWPVPVLSVAGILIFALGWVLRKEKR